jgi:Phage protein (N4 Gp49/phage Sf6 gene 66) family
MINLNVRYSEKEIGIFLDVLESILRSKDSGEFILNGNVAEIELKRVEKMENKVTKEQIDKMILDSEIETLDVFNKTTIVSCKLPNGFVITESSSCVDPANYDRVMGYEICMRRIENKLWELEGYKLQEKLFRK